MRLVYLLALICIPLSCMAKKPKYRYNEYEQSVNNCQPENLADRISAKQPELDVKRPELNMTDMRKLLETLRNGEYSNTKLQYRLAGILRGLNIMNVPNTSEAGSKKMQKNGNENENENENENYKHTTGNTNCPPILEATEDACDIDDFDTFATCSLKMICDIKLRANLMIKVANSIEMAIFSETDANDNHVSDKKKIVRANQVGEEKPKQLISGRPYPFGWLDANMPSDKEAEMQCSMVSNSNRA